MTRRQIFFRVTLLQMVKRVVPPMSNEIITLVKDTSLANTIGVVELIRSGETFRTNGGLIWPFFYTGRVLPGVRGRADHPVQSAGKEAQLLPGVRGGEDMAILQVESIQKQFGKIPVLRDISFDLERGQALAIIGSSGSGKTTLLRCLNFLETPDQGRIIVNGETLFDAADPRHPAGERGAEKRLHFGWCFSPSTCFPSTPP